jgi:hypothetical protein
MPTKSDVFITKAQREAGRRARQRAMQRAGSSRISDAAWWPEVELLTNRGMTNAQIAKAVNLSDRRVREIKQNATESGSVVLPDYIPNQELPSDVQPMLDFSADGFKKFYEKFSGYDLPQHCYGWVQAFCDNRNLMLNVPPRHMKSSIFSLWVPVWLLCRDRNERILLVSLTKESAKKWVSGIAEQLTANEELITTFGVFKPAKMGDTAWRPMSGTLMVQGRSKTTGVQYSVESRGSGQQILGMEATVVFVDDVTDKKIAENEEARNKQLDWLRGEVLSRVETQQSDSSGRAVIIGQRLHVHDIYGQLRRQTYERGPKEGDSLWTTISTPAILRWPDEDPDHPEPAVLWPEKWTFDELMLTYERVGGHAVFSAMYQQEPILEGQGVFKPDWWVRCRDYDRPGGEGVRAPNGMTSQFPIARVLSIDPSVRQYHGLIVADVLYDRDSFFAVILEAKRWKGPQRSIIKEIERAMETYSPDYFVFENVSFIQWLREDPFFQDLKDFVKIMPHQTGKNKGDPDRGVESLAREAEFMQIRLPYGDDWGREMSRALEAEANEFPHGPTSDLLMALWFIKWNYKKFIPYHLTWDKLRWMPDAAQNVWAGFERVSYG